MDFMNAISAIQTSNDLAKFVENLRQDLLANPDKWENANLDTFLNALAAWVSDSDGYYLNNKKKIPEAITWQTVALVLLAARSYE